MDFDLPNRPGLVKLPAGLNLNAIQEVVVFLIKAELKNRKFSEQLEQLGFDPTYAALDLGTVVLQLMGFRERSDDTYEWYQKRVEEYLPKLTLRDDDEALNFLALELFRELDSKKVK